ncbi:MAG TPA: SUMF1/EgtB/PvdO family nonheme iron enzyme [Fimbriimonadaceae bacterium]|jgi:sulfatase modifying factor 1
MISILVFLPASLVSPTEGFVTVPAGSYQVGKQGDLDNPLRKVKLKSFEIAKTDVTNADFEAFVKATGHKTVAERLHNGMVFEPPLKEFQWKQDPTAYWRYPNGITRGGIESEQDHPVTGICYDDALAYCKWAHVRLPSFEEWEVACRAGTKTDYFFGNSPDQIGAYAHVWHGRDHMTASNSDGYAYTAPVGHFKPNPLGLYDMYGNVFQFCSGRLPMDHADWQAHARGGSWWCSRNSCCSFNSFYIGTVVRFASFSNLGFRVVRG